MGNEFQVTACPDGFEISGNERDNMLGCTPLAKRMSSGAGKFSPEGTQTAVIPDCPAGTYTGSGVNCLMWCSASPCTAGAWCETGSANASNSCTAG